VGWPLVSDLAWASRPTLHGMQVVGPRRLRAADKEGWIQAERASSDPGRVHGGQVRGQEGLDRQVPLQPWSPPTAR
jgi:hypothetical protein